MRNPTFALGIHTFADLRVLGIVRCGLSDLGLPARSIAWRFTLAGFLSDVIGCFRPP
jgi:hypothetical protein